MGRPVEMWNAGSVETNVSGGETARVRGDWEIPWDTIAVAGGNERKSPGVNLEPIQAQQGSFNCQFVGRLLKRDDGSVT
jgi:hypothetical protein